MVVVKHVIGIKIRRNVRIKIVIMQLMIIRVMISVQLGWIHVLLKLQMLVV